MGVTEYKGFLIIINSDRTYEFDGVRYMRFYEVVAKIDSIVKQEK